MKTDLTTFDLEKYIPEWLLTQPGANEVNLSDISLVNDWKTLNSGKEFKTWSVIVTGPATFTYTMKVIAIKEGDTLLSIDFD
jgi:hypothetical protein